MLEGEIISIGNELLQGRMDDTNATHISRRLSECGVRARFRTTVGDRQEDIVAALERASHRADVVLCTGGLGPTVDDLTAPAAAAFLGVPLRRDMDVDAHVRKFHALFGIPCPDNALDQALVPEGASIIMNPAGTAPCIWFKKNRASFAFFPGVPREMKALLDTAIDALLGDTPRAVSVTRTLRLFGVGESSLQNLLPRDIITSENPSFSFLPEDYQIHLRLTAYADSETDCRAMLDKSCDRIYEHGGEHIYGEGNATLEQVVCNKLRERGLTLAVAESVTGGMITSRLVNVPGASQVLKGGVTAYSVEAKKELLEVSTQTLKQYGPVSEEITLELAYGALARLDAGLGLAVTGNAGPDVQGQAPVGQVYVALVFKAPARQPVTFSRRVVRGRNDVRGLAALFAIDMVRRNI